MVHAHAQAGESHRLDLTHEQFTYLLRLLQRDATAHLQAADKGKQTLGEAAWVAHLKDLGDLLEVFLGPGDE